MPAIELRLKLVMTGLPSPAQRGARPPSKPVAKRFEVQPAVLGIEHRAEDHDLAVEGALEIVLVVLQRAGTQIGKGIGRNVVGAALEIDGHGVRHGLTESGSRPASPFRRLPISACASARARASSSAIAGHLGCR